MKITFSDKVPIKRTMCIERLFHPNLAMSYRDKLHVLNQADLAVWMFIDNVLMGEAYGVSPSRFDEEIEGLAVFKQNKNVTYLYSIAIAERFQGKGLGKILMSYYLGVVTGFDRIVLGHFLEGPSDFLAQTFGGEFVKKFPNWYGTDRTAILRKISLP